MANFSTFIDSGSWCRLSIVYNWLFIVSLSSNSLTFICWSIAALLIGNNFTRYLLDNTSSQKTPQDPEWHLPVLSNINLCQGSIVILTSRSSLLKRWFSLLRTPCCDGGFKNNIAHILTSNPLQTHCTVWWRTVFFYYCHGFIGLLIFLTDFICRIMSHQASTTSTSSCEHFCTESLHVSHT